MAQTTAVCWGKKRKPTEGGPRAREEVCRDSQQSVVRRGSDVQLLRVRRTRSTQTEQAARAGGEVKVVGRCSSAPATAPRLLRKRGAPFECQRSRPARSNLCGLSVRQQTLRAPGPAPHPPFPFPARAGQRALPADGCPHTAARSRASEPFQRELVRTVLAESRSTCRALTFFMPHTSLSKTNVIPK